jgi:hypothetical protein
VCLVAFHVYFIQQGHHQNSTKEIFKLGYRSWFIQKDKSFLSLLNICNFNRNVFVFFLFN